MDELRPRNVNKDGGVWLHSTGDATAEERKIILGDPARYTGPMGFSTPRNGPCPCGSGRKAKKCHGRRV